MFAPVELLEKIGLPSEHDVRVAAEELLKELKLGRRLPVRLTPICRYFRADVQPAPEGKPCIASDNWPSVNRNTMRERAGY